MRTKICTLLFLVGFFLLPTALAINTQGLHWGVFEGQEIQYRIHVELDYESTSTTTTTKITEGIIYTITQLPDIPEVVEETYQIPYPHGDLAFANGSEFYGLSMPISLLIMPVGNWSMIHQLYKESVEESEMNVTWINDFSNWGFSYTMPDYYNPDSELTMKVRFSKADGVLSYASVLYNYGEEGRMLTTLTRLGGPIDVNMLLIVGGVAAAIVVIVVVIIKARS